MKTISLGPERGSLFTNITNNSNVRVITCDPWDPNEAPLIHKTLEAPNWAPWLSYSPTALRNMVLVNPEGQFLVKINGRAAGYLSTNRTDWSGLVRDLSSWDSVAGNSVEDVDYKETYNPTGNTIVMMSMSIDPDFKGSKVAGILVQVLKQKAEALKVEYIIGPFRPSGYGEYKLVNGTVDFEEYCNMKRNDGAPIDPWLRSMTNQGMVPLKIEPKAMVVDVSLEKFEQYRNTYHPDRWKAISPYAWECGEVGTWEVLSKNARYMEANLWGRVPF